MSKNAFIRGSKSLTVFYDHKTYVIPLGYESEQALKAIAEDRWSDIPSIVDKSKAINQYSKGCIQVRGGHAFIDDEALPSTLSNTLIQFMEEKAPYQSLIKFWKRLKNNNSYRAVNELYGFLEANNIPILDDGRILTYKVVRKSGSNKYRSPGTYKHGNVTVFSQKGGIPQYVDIHSRTVLQSVGDVVSMKPRDVDDDKNSTCSKGLHLAAWSYIPHFGNAFSGDDVVLECALDPAHVVSIPVDYSNSKLRCCQYEILGINDELTERRTSYVSDYSFDDEYDLDEYYYDEDDDDDWM